MTTRSTRRPQVQDPLSNLESLLLAQAVWELGAGPNSWSAVAKLLSKHPLLSRPKSFFNTQSCRSIYEQLMKDADLELNESNHNPHALMNLKLAEKHYCSRHAELRELIMAEESKFKTVLKEIEDIRAGLWDKEIQAKLTRQSTPEPPTLQEVVSATQTSDEVFDGSDLSGVSESAESSSSSEKAKEPTSTSVEIVEAQLQEEGVPSTDTLEQEDYQKDTKLPSPPPVPDIVEETAEADVQEEMPLEPEEIQKESLPPSHAVQGETAATSPAGEIIPTELMNEVDAGQNDEDSHMDSLEATATTELLEDNAETMGDHGGELQEEEEEEINEEKESKEEEEEASQGHEEEVRMEPDEDEDGNPSSPKSAEQVEVETESEPIHTPEADTAPSEAEPAADEGHSSGSEEPVVPARRSTRRRKSSAASVPPPQTRKRLRSQARVPESEPQTAMESENEGDAGVKEEETPQPEDEASSPFDGGMTRRRDGKRKASFLEGIESPLEKKRLREDSEPADEDEPGPSSHNTRARVTRHGTRTEEQVALKRFQNVIGMLHSQISQHRNGNIFHNPIKNSEAPDYHEIVKRPMDLKTIKTRVKDGVIANSLEFQRDIFLMFANAMMYNRPGSDVHAMAEDMMLESEGQIIAFRQTEGLVKRGQRP